MKKLCTLLLAAGLVFGAATGASAIDFKAKGQWLMGFTAGDFTLIQKTRDGNQRERSLRDQFDARQRLRLQLEAVASENLSGTVWFQVGNNIWGQASTGGALGADATNVIKVRGAWIDWMVPDTDLKVRMGLQPIVLPNVAGGSAIMDSRAAAVVASYKVNDNASVTAMWMRPFNDNYSEKNRNGYLDNMDLFSLMLPLSFDGFEVTPWAMYGMKGKNTLFPDKESDVENLGTDGNVQYTLHPYPGINDFLGTWHAGNTNKAYGSMFWAGLPFSITALDPLNIEVDLNYGYVEGMGRYDAIKEGAVKRSSTERQGWLAKALVEYKMDWGVPGIFGWYASGDDGNPKNGSERMPSLVGCGTFTSFMGDGNMGWSWQDYNMDYAGTWGVGLQLRDMSFLQDLTHTFRVAYWGGTNSTGMVKYMQNAYSWSDGWGEFDGPYLTTNDGLLEFNLVNNYQMYENFNVNLELGYIANFIDNDTWKKAGERNSSFQKRDAWKAQLVFAYSF